MKIDFIITSMDIGGAETQLVAVSKKLNHLGHDVRIISLLEPCAFADDLKRNNIPLLSVDMRKTIIGIVLGFVRLIRLLRAGRADVMHAHMVHANLICRFVKLTSLVNSPLVCTAHNTYEGGAFLDFCYRYTNVLSTLNTAVSHAATKRLIKDKVLPAGRTITVNNGIELDRFSTRECNESQPGSFRWVSVGRLCDQKNFSFLVEAFAKLCQQDEGFDAILEIYGKGPLYHKLLKQIESFGLSQRVFLKGVRTDIEKVYASADAFVLPSVFEGYGLVVAEAMAAGLPVVVTDCGGPTEIVGRDGKNGLIVNPGDIDEMTAAMRTIMQMPEYKRKVMGSNGRERVRDKFSIESTCRSWESIYARLLPYNNCDSL